MAIENFGYACTLKDISVADAREVVIKALSKEGFEVLNETDMRKELRRRLDEDFRNYLILGVWQPELAHESLGAEPNAGLLVPFHVVIQDRLGAPGVVVTLQNPTAFSGKAGNHELDGISRRTDGLMQKVVLDLGGKITGKHPADLDDVIPMHPDGYPAKSLKSRLDSRREEGLVL